MQHAPSATILGLPTIKGRHTPSLPMKNKKWTVSSQLTISLYESHKTWPRRQTVHKIFCGYETLDLCTRNQSALQTLSNMTWTTPTNSKGMLKCYHGVPSKFILSQPLTVNIAMFVDIGMVATLSRDSVRHPIDRIPFQGTDPKTVWKRAFLDDGITDVQCYFMKIFFVLGYEIPDTPRHGICVVI